MSTIGASVAPSGNGKSHVSVGARVVVAYICENCARPGLVPSSGVRRRPSAPDFAWPFPVTEILVPCGGRLQPEHVLKAFEDGADAVAVVCCEEGNCHHHEGNRRCSRRIDYVNGLLSQIGLGSDRAKVYHLPGSAKEDMALGLLPSQKAALDPAMSRKVAAVRDAFVAHLATLTPNPMRKGTLPEESPYEVDSDDESDE